MEVVGHQEAAAQQVLAQARGFDVVQVPAADLDRVEPRIVEDRVVRDLEHASLLADLDAREPADAQREVILGVGLVGVQPPRPQRAAAAS